MKLSFFIFSISFISSVYSGVCEDRKQIVTKAIKNNNSTQNHKAIMSNNYKLIVLGEPHGTHYLEKLPLIIPLLSKGIKCTFIEQPYQLQQSEIDQLLQGEKTKHFQTDASFDYVPFYKYLRENKIEIIPIDNRLDHADGILPLDYMTKRDEGMYNYIKANIDRCSSSLYLVGKHHLTPDIAGYNEPLGRRLKKDFKDEVLIVDMIASKNMNEEYCSYSQNNLFKSKNVLLKGDSVGNLRYSTFVSNSFWSDFDYILHLKRDIGKSITFD
jgi:hypothetical protein